MKSLCKNPKCTCGTKPYESRNLVESGAGRNHQDDVYSMVLQLHQPCSDSYEPLDPSLADKVVRRSKKEVNDITLPRQTVPAKFDYDELTIGHVCGNGGFSSVHEIKGFTFNERRNYTPEEILDRQLLVNDCKKGNSQFAVKHLRSKLISRPKKFANGAIDLVLESEFLACFDHPNILKIRGISADGVEGYQTGRHDSFFLIVDCLKETLEERIISWRRSFKRFNHKLVGKFVDKKGNKRTSLMIERLGVALEIASALEYIHSNGMIYRDLKANNVGFDAKGNVQLFDFGLCRQLPNGDIDQVFQLSGCVGTRHTMAPEVANKMMYNAKADVFSFAMVLYEILSLNQLPRGKNNCNDSDGESKETALRTCKCWPPVIKNILRRAWSTDPSLRPTMKEVCFTLRSEILRHETPETCDATMDASDSSGFVMKNQLSVSSGTHRSASSTRRGMSLHGKRSFYLPKENI
eukprot:CAMPEP_0202478552 /NCGR_PEP_ID=MMETSP1360-20130828/94515_1 /ASSEMBLY_ACC=CAM_ASM_000848 /TAXON_ID=515479 /ORGANISM="Licmophora paradoxa, Strain CCMP2313" /LENGTH=464 /DNA_ID=CAMNT_0049105831 /DNA_START=16 /DNA_END=1410 /DNA_ORIENTATION=-